MTRRTHRYATEVVWTGNRGAGTSSYQSYSRDHEIRVRDKPVLAGSSDPAFRGNPELHNPEELLVAALSACHMLWYLHLCADSGVVVIEYRDEASGLMAETPGEAGRFDVVELRPKVVIHPSSAVDMAVLLHERAHELCYIANSVNFPVRCTPTVTASQILALPGARVGPEPERALLTCSPRARLPARKPGSVWS